VITNAYQVKALQDLGIDISKLGCVMLDFEQIPVKDWLPEEWAYYPKDPKYFWIKGLDVKSHVTLLYGLLEKAYIWREHVDEVLAGWVPGEVWIKRLGYFPSTIQGEDYACLVGHLEGEGLEQAHQLLSFLPHVNTHLEYKPHVTLGYVRRNRVDHAMMKLTGNPVVLVQTLKILGLNYGEKPA
jgi:hypothetical protein